MYTLILAALTLLPMETTESYQDAVSRLKTMALALDHESRRSEAAGVMPRKVLLATTIAVWWHESRFSPAVHRGERTKWGSDEGRAKCFGQLHASGIVPRHEWERLTGTDLESTRRCAEATMRVIQTFARWCQWKGDDASYMRVIGAYATGRGCVLTKHGPTRVKTIRKVLRWL